MVFRLLLVCFEALQKRFRIDDNGFHIAIDAHMFRIGFDGACSTIYYDAVQAQRVKVQQFHQTDD